MPTKIILIRHGETVLSLKKAYYGITDTRLTANGKKQAKSLTAKLQREKVQKVYSSDLRRAFDFAKIIFKDYPIEKNSQLRELNFGILEKMTYEQIMKKCPELYSSWIKKPFDTCIPKGEHLRDFKNRVLDCFNNILRANTDKITAIVSHAGPIRIILNEILKPKDIWSIEVNLASINVITFCRGGPCVRPK
ncbi:MAG: histidine phosphatase family protein [Candidatus Omnitrophota bacterium]